MLCGWIPDAHDPRDWRFEESKIAVLRPITGADSIDYRAYDTKRVQFSGSCVGQSCAGAAAIVMAIAGTPLKEFPSALWPYAGARLLARPKQALTDVGCSPRFAMAWLRDKGLIAESRWREVAENVNAVPPLDAFQEGEAATVEAFYRIESGDGASDAIRTALKRGYCPMFAMIVDKKYESTGRNIYDSPGGEILGGHMQVIVGYSAVVDAFIVRNTWSDAFGDEGYAYVAASLINRVAKDIWVIQAAPGDIR